LGKGPTGGSIIGSNDRDSFEDRYIPSISQVRSVSAHSTRQKYWNYLKRLDWISKPE